MEHIVKALKTPLKFHWSILLLLALFIMSYGMAWGVVNCILIILSVLIHEYTHVWMASRQGINTSKIIFMFLGAAALIEVEKISPLEEFKISVVGPLSSLVLAGISYGFLFLSSGFLWETIWLYCMAINLIMAIFNMLPIWPIDGGRCLNALMSFIFGDLKGIKISSIISFALSGIGIIISLIYREWYMIFLFIILILFAKTQKDVLIRKIYSDNRVSCFFY